MAAKKNIKKTKTKKPVLKSKTSVKKPIKVIAKKPSKPVLKKPVKKQKSGFREFLSFNNFSHFLLFMLFILSFVIFCDFLIKFSVYTTAPALIIYNTNFSMAYYLYNLLFLLTFFLLYFMYAYQAVVKKLSFDKIFRSIFGLSIFLFILESLLVVISYFSFLKDYYVLFNITHIGYIFYLLIWVLIKYIVLILVTFIAYKIFKRFKDRYSWY